MKRLTFITSAAAAIIAAAAPAVAGPGGQGRGGGMGAVQGQGGPGTGTTMRETARSNSQGPANADPRAIERVNSNSVLSGETFTGSRIPRGRDNRGDTERAAGSSSVSAMANVKLTGVETGMTVNDADGVMIGTVTNVTTKGDGSIRTVQVTLTDGQIITLAPNSLTLEGDVLTTTSLTSNVKSQGALHANINGLINASPNSALASAGVTSLTGLDTGLTVNNSGGTLVGTVDQIFVNRTGGVVAISVALDGGGTATIPATTLSMDGTTVITNSTQF